MPTSLSLFAPNPLLLAAQRRVLEVALELLELDQRLYEIAVGLPLPPTYIAMEEELIPYTGVGQMYVTVQRVKGQYLQPAIQALLAVTQQRDEELLEAFVSRD